MITESQACRLRDGVRAAYSSAADSPTSKHPFPVGRGFAESLGYPAELLNSLPDLAVEAFAGVSNVSIFADVPEGVSVLDLGCGAGLDTMIAARRVGAKGRVTGVDFSQSMLTRARSAAAELGVTNAVFLEGTAENIPCPAASFDIAIINGIFNLNPAREAIFRELSRVLKSGASASIAELILKEPLLADVCISETNWFA
ncbi:MAG: methyltransferase domain-containing protein [Planctomycetes bacterium]|nr:methyltransferase domain-containing protein [Planctomycetota bacterium]MBI3833427.1 methyltransferase domain-containing protein [Planctomycetota bacterium]